MKKKWYTLLFTVILCSCSLEEQFDYTKYVNSLIGNAENGHTFPGGLRSFWDNTG